MPQRNRSQRLSGQYPLSYVGVNPVSPSNFIIDNRPPGPTDAQNFLIGDIWLDNSAYPAAPKAENVWMLVSLTGGVATWIDFAGGGDLKSLTGNVGGPVFGDGANNINTVGDGVGITVTGNPGTHTLTWSLVGGGVATQSYLTDDTLVEVPNAGGQLTVTGTGVTSVGNVYSNINTLRGANVNTVGTALNNSIGQPNTNTAATQGMYALGGANNFVLDRFMYNYGTHNTFLGNLSGNLAITTANCQNNTCIGFGTGNALTTANQCTFVGSFAGAANQTSLNNTFVGYVCGVACNGGGGKNTSVGSTSSNGLTTGTQNSAFGDLALGVTTGSNNSVFGYNAGSNYTGAESQNICIGSSTNSAGKTGEVGTIWIGSNPSGATQNIFIGNGAGNVAYTTANNVTVVGTSAAASITSAIHSVAVGNGAINAGTSCDNSTAVGSTSMTRLTTGTQNTAIGAASGAALLTGSNNCYFGNIAGNAHVGAESDNIIIGATVPGVAAETNALHIGAATGGAAGVGQLNKAFICGIRGITTANADAIAVLVDSANQLGTISSTKHVKDNIKKMGSYSDVLYDLRPVTFNYKQHTPDMISVGLIAEEVEEVMPRLVAYQDGKPMSVKYHDLSPMLLNELQKLEKRISELERNCKCQN